MKFYMGSIAFVLGLVTANFGAAGETSWCLIAVGSAVAVIGFACSAAATGVTLKQS